MATALMPTATCAGSAGKIDREEKEKRRDPVAHRTHRTMTYRDRRAHRNVWAGGPTVRRTRSSLGRSLNGWLAVMDEIEDHEPASASSGHEHQ